jgi:hypothetical protein
MFGLGISVLYLTCGYILRTTIKVYELNGMIYRKTSSYRTAGRINIYTYIFSKVNCHYCKRKQKFLLFCSSTCLITKGCQFCFKVSFFLSYHKTSTIYYVQSKRAASIYWRFEFLLITRQYVKAVLYCL